VGHRRGGDRKGKKKEIVKIRQYLRQSKDLTEGAVGKNQGGQGAIIRKEKKT